MDGMKRDLRRVSDALRDFVPVARYYGDAGASAAFDRVQRQVLAESSNGSDVEMLLAGLEVETLSELRDLVEAGRAA